MRTYNIDMRHKNSKTLFVYQEIYLILSFQAISYHVLAPMSQWLFR